MATRIVTGLVRFSYVNIFNARSFQDGQEAKYSVQLLIPKKDKEGVAKIRAAINEAVEEGISSVWKGKKPKNIRLPLRDGDEERADENPEYEGMLFMNTTSKLQPGVVDKDRIEILDADEVYSGCWGRASISFFAYDQNGNRGISAGLNNIQKLKEGKRLGGSRTKAEDDFDDDFELDEEDDF